MERTIADRDGRQWKAERRLGDGVGARGFGTGLPVPGSWLIVFSSLGTEVGASAEYESLDALSDDELRGLLENASNRYA